VVERKRERVRRMQGSLEALSPLQVLERGYAIAFDRRGKAIRGIGQLPSGTRFELRLRDGSVEADSV
jgi:exodeoxyribonuclease VII large subunit